MLIWIFSCSSMCNSCPKFVRRNAGARAHAHTHAHTHAQYILQCSLADCQSIVSRVNSTPYFNHTGPYRQEYMVIRINYYMYYYIAHEGCKSEIYLAPPYVAEICRWI
jgi:hypothetical protein